MALGINSYNDVFRNFAEFAQKSLEAGDEKAIAAVDESQSIAARTHIARGVRMQSNA